MPGAGCALTLHAHAEGGGGSCISMWRQACPCRSTMTSKALQLASPETLETAFRRFYQCELARQIHLQLQQLKQSIIVLLHAEVVVFTAGLRDYAQPILDHLHSKYGALNLRLYREATSACPAYPCVKVRIITAFCVAVMMR